MITDKMNLKAVRRKSISVSQQELIKTELFQPEQLLPLVIQPAVGDKSTTWATTNHEWIDTLTEARRAPFPKLGTALSLNNLFRQFLEN